MYSRKHQDRELTFTFSPHKYLDNLMLTDLETGSLWSQLNLRAVAGERDGSQLRRLPSVQTTWRHWRSMFPATQVFDLAPGDGVRVSHRSLQRIAHPRQGPGPTGDQQQPKGQHPIEADIQPLELILGVSGQDSARAYPFSRLAARTGPLRDSLEDRLIMIHFDRTAFAAWATNEKGGLLPAVTTRLRVWQGFYPHTSVWGVKSDDVPHTALTPHDEVPTVTDP